jgi:hypothetical protein
MIRVEIEEENNTGRYLVCVPSYRLSFKSKLPLLDACRRIKSMGGDTSAVCGLFRKGRSEPDATCTVEGGAGFTVSESAGRPRFQKFRPFERGAFLEAAE